MMKIASRMLLILVGIAIVAAGVWFSWLEGGAIGVIFNVLVVILVAALVQIPLDRTRRLIHALLWLWPLAAYFFSNFGILFFGDEQGNEKFYELVAQIIPILVLALTVELRLLSPAIVTAPGQIAAGVLTIFLLALGEFFSLASVVSHTGSEEAFATATASLVAGFVGLIVGALASYD